MTATPAEVRSAYRRLFRTALHVINYQKPYRYQVRSILRDSFRNASIAAFVPRRIENTIKFLEGARDYNGTEFKIFKSITHVRYWRDNPRKFKHVGSLNDNTDVGRDLRKNLPAHFDATLTVFNESADLCLRV